MTKHFTDEEREKIKREIEHAEMFGWSNDETIQAIERIIGRPISRPHYFTLKRETLDDNEVTNWITTFARSGFIHHYQQRIKEITYTNQILLKSIEHETDKPIEKWNKNLIGALIRNHREHEALLLAAGFGSPVLLQVKELIEKGNVSFNNNRHNEPTEESRQDSTEDRNTDSGSDENAVF